MPGPRRWLSLLMFATACIVIALGVWIVGQYIVLSILRPVIDPNLSR